MTNNDRHYYEMLLRVKQFGAEHGDLFPNDSFGGRTFAALAAAVGEASGYFTSQAQGRGAARSGTLSKAAARVALRRTLTAVARTARAVGVDVSGLRGKFRLPDGLNDLELVTAGRAFTAEATPLADRFIAHGLPATFLADLRSALAGFEHAAQTRMTARETHASARAGIRAAFDAAREVIARLDAIVPNTVRDNPVTLAAWALARRVPRAAAGRDGGVPRDGQATAASTTAAGSQA